jgi:hypothetical protein
MDFWHQRRLLRIEEHDADLAFGGRPFVIGNVVTVPEPIWRTLVETAVTNGAPDLFAGWSWDHPLDSGSAERLAQALVTTIDTVARTRTVQIPESIADAHQPDPDIVLTALRAVQPLLTSAAALHARVETWVD